MAKVVLDRVNDFGVAMVGRESCNCKLLILIIPNPASSNVCGGDVMINGNIFSLAFHNR